MSKFTPFPAVSDYIRLTGAYLYRILEAQARRQGARLAEQVRLHGGGLPEQRDGLVGRLRGG